MQINNLENNMSIIIQGPIINDKFGEKKLTKQVCLSIRLYFPNAEIILSTWAGSDTKELEYDLLVENKDPGSTDSLYKGENGEKSCNNFNRQIVTTQNGIKAASKKYVMKLRSDTIITGSKFLKYFIEYGFKECSDNGFTNRILTLEPRNPFGYFSGAFCLCDFWFFGLKEDMLRLWQIPLYIKYKYWDRDLLGEEYLFYNHIKTIKNISFEALMHDKTGFNNKKLFQKIMAADFVIVPTRRSDIVCLKYPKLNSFFVVCICHYVWSFSDWKANYDSFYEYKNSRYKVLSKLEGISGAIVLFLKNIKEKRKDEKGNYRIIRNQRSNTRPHI